MPIDPSPLVTRPHAWGQLPTEAPCLEMGPLWGRAGWGGVGGIVIQQQYRAIRDTSATDCS